MHRKFFAVGDRHSKVLAIMINWMARPLIILQGMKKNCYESIILCLSANYDRMGTESTLLIWVHDGFPGEEAGQWK